MKEGVEKEEGGEMGTVPFQSSLSILNYSTENGTHTITKENIQNDSYRKFRKNQVREK